MPLLKHVRRYLGGPEVVHECRRCGATLESIHDDCDACGAAEVVRYTIE